MRKAETVSRNISLTFDLLNQIIDNPDLMTKIPNQSVVEFVQKDMPITEHEGKKGQKSKYFKVKREFEAL